MMRLIGLCLGLCCIFQPAPAQELKRILPVGHSAPPFFAAASKDGKRFVTLADDNTIKIWDGYTGKLLTDTKAHADRIINKISISPDGQQLLTSSFDNTIKIWDIQTGKLKLAITDTEGLAGEALFSPDGKRILSMSDNSVRIWDAVSGQPLGKLEGGHT
ncbi:MAG TPA: hypothetical protein PK977_16020, partial [Chitinophagaceae bacterium]|nr:hypothetical protein [Chitinophagaceae bacterium]